MELDNSKHSLFAAGSHEMTISLGKDQGESDRDGGKETILGDNDSDDSQPTDNEPRSPIPYHHLPPEILLVIFRFALPPPVFLNPRTITSSIEQKKALLVVCRSWHDAAMEMLYEEVHLHSLISLLRFINALEESGRGSHVKSLTIDALTPTPDSRTDFQTPLILNRALHLCTNLAFLSFTLAKVRDGNWLSSVFEEFENTPWFDIPAMLMLPNISHLRELHIGNDALRFLHGHFSKFAHSLEVLALYFDTSLIVTPRIKWPHLKWLRCIFPKQAFGINTLAKSFEMPQLECLTIAADLPMKFDGSRRSTDIRFDAYPLIRAHKERLVYLCLVGIRPGNEGLQTLFDMTPHLRHLVVDSDLVKGWNGFLPSHQTLEHVDIWCRCTGVTGSERREELEGPGDLLSVPGKSEELPSFKSVRIFDRALIFTRASVDLPAAISPEDWMANGHHQYPGLFDIGIASGGKVIYRNDLSYVYERWDWGKLSSFYQEEEEHYVEDNDRPSCSSPVPWYYRRWAQDPDGISDYSDEDADYAPDDGSSTHSADEYDSGSVDSFYLDGFGVE
ncbi:hypothetical protein V5O48_017011 [Marasmius crinis-equi]|uniref:F-box domain-containing protein n=1 Tax=Marasmius crinis-equi TaxID=585013 RepID=A0ABR3EQB2_9AGAR